MKKIIWVFMFLVMVGVVCGATNYTKAPASCVKTYLSIDCSAIGNVCGYNDPAVYCYDTSTITMPSVYNSAYQAQVTGSGFNAGYLIDCLSYDAGSPYCDTFKCQVSTTCYNNKRTTRCNSTTVTDCTTCWSGYNDCNNDAGLCECQNGASCTVSGQTGTVQANSTGGYCSGTSCNCVISKNYFITNTSAVYLTPSNGHLLWGTDYGTGNLMWLWNNANRAGIKVNGSGCIVFNDSTKQCTATTSSSGTYQNNVTYLNYSGNKGNLTINNGNFSLGNGSVRINFASNRSTYALNVSSKSRLRPAIYASSNYNNTWKVSTSIAYGSGNRNTMTSNRTTSNEIYIENTNGNYNDYLLGMYYKSDKKSGNGGFIEAINAYWDVGDLTFMRLGKLNSGYGTYAFYRYANITQTSGEAALKVNNAASCSSPYKYGSCAIGTGLLVEQSNNWNNSIADFVDGGGRYYTVLAYPRSTTGFNEFYSNFNSSITESPLVVIRDTNKLNDQDVLKVQGYGDGNLQSWYNGTTKMATLNETDLYANLILKIGSSLIVNPSGRIDQMGDTGVFIQNSGSPALTVRQTTGNNNIQNWLSGAATSRAYLDELGNYWCDNNITMGQILQLTPRATAPPVCTEGQVYSDTSGAICYCYTANTWEMLGTQGACT